MKIGIFGGCFNPPHQKHKNIAIELMNQKYLDKVIFVPTGNFYQKKELATDEARYEMLKLLIKNQPNLEVSRYEFGNLTYTYQTLTHFKKKYKDDEIYFICGSDNLAEFSTWKEYEYILENFKLLVIKRNQLDSNYLLKKYKKYQDHIIFAEVKEQALSSTMIRNAFYNKKEEQIKTYIDQPIYNYIQTNMLYQKEKRLGGV